MGIVKIQIIGTIRSQVLREPTVPMDAVQRLNVGGLVGKKKSTGIR